MRELDRTLQMGLPAQGVHYDARPVETFSASYIAKADLAREVPRLARRGQVRPLDERPRWDTRTGPWEHRVLRLSPAPPAGLRPLLVTGSVLAALGVLAVLAWWVLTTLSAGTLLLFLIVVFMALCGAVRAGRPPTVIVNQNVSIR